MAANSSVIRISSTSPLQTRQSREQPLRCHCGRKPG